MSNTAPVTRIVDLWCGALLCVDDLQNSARVTGPSIISHYDCKHAWTATNTIDVLPISRERAAMSLLSRHDMAAFFLPRANRHV